MADEMARPTGVGALYREWFLDYASYVILDRAVPAVEDGLKPVQRRLLYAMYLMDDGRYHKVANIVGNTMRYHPHGDASIYDALVNLGQKGLLVDTQGNWGNPLTGDPAAAARYIEARLTSFAREVLFNPKITRWQATYDGRAREPVWLPVKFPLVLLLGAEGIAVGLSTRILPHNFNELIEAAIAYLEDRPYELYPDFPTGGLADVSGYRHGTRGGRVRVRARIEVVDARTLRITEIPFGTTTTSLMESIVAAADKGKIRIRKVEDNTAAAVEILVHLPAGVSPHKTVDALYAFTDCEVTLSTVACVIAEDRPWFASVEELLAASVDRTRQLLQEELELRLEELEDAWHMTSLERIFIEERIYRRIESEETWEGVLATIRTGLEPHLDRLRRPPTDEDIVRLTEIKIRRISRYDAARAAERLAEIDAEIAAVRAKLADMRSTTIAWFRHLQARYGELAPRRTELTTFDTVRAAQVAAASHKLYVDRREGFVGTRLTKAEPVGTFSEHDELLVIRRDGKGTVVPVTDKLFVGKEILYVGRYRRGDDPTVYHMVYRRADGAVYAKRFRWGGAIRGREYDLVGGKGRILYLRALPGAEAEEVEVVLRPAPRLRKRRLPVDFGTMPIRGREARGKLVTRHAVARVVSVRTGGGTIELPELWYDEAERRLNTEGRGRSLGRVAPGTLLVAIDDRGLGRTWVPAPDLTLDRVPVFVELVPPGATLTLVYLRAEKEALYLKRLALPEGGLPEWREVVPPERGNRFVGAAVEPVRLRVRIRNRRGERELEVAPAAFTPVKGLAARGRQLAPEGAELRWLTGAAPETAPSDPATEATAGAPTEPVPEPQVLPLFPDDATT